MINAQKQEQSSEWEAVLSIESFESEVKRFKHL